MIETDDFCFRCGRAGKIGTDFVRLVNNCLNPRLSVRICMECIKLAKMEWIK